MGCIEQGSTCCLLRMVDAWHGGGSLPCGAGSTTWPLRSHSPPHNPPGNRPVQLKKSTWDDRQVKDKTGKPIKRLVEEKAKKPDKRARAGASFEAGVGPPVQQAFYTRR